MSLSQAPGRHSSYAMWQRTLQPVPTVFHSGSVSEQTACARGQRGWNRQPDGGFSGDGSSPFKTTSCPLRRLRFPEQKEIVIANTVGFIRNLPDELMEAFRATLEELESADLLVHVADASHQDLFQQIDSVQDILIQLGLEVIPCLLVLNKWDKVPEAAKEDLLQNFPNAIPVSAVQGTGLEALLGQIEERLLSEAQLYSDPQLLSGILDEDRRPDRQHALLNGVLEDNSLKTDAEETLPSLWPYAETYGLAERSDAEDDAENDGADDEEDDASLSNTEFSYTDDEAEGRDKK